MNAALQWSCFVAAALVAAVLIFRTVRRPGWMGGLLVGALALAALAAWHHETRSLAKARHANAHQSKIPKTGDQPGYVTQDQCAACHPGPYQSWHDSFHRRMTQYATPDSVLGDFNERDFEVDGHRIHLQQRGDEFWAEMVDPDWTHDQARAKAGWPGYRLQRPEEAPRLWTRIGLVTGSHRFQAYWVASKHGNLQLGFPLAWLVDEQRWVPRKDTFIRDPDAESPHQIWNMNCIQCHTTGGVPNPDPLTGRLESKAADLGIACEACHGPGERHVEAYRNPFRRYLQYARAQPDPFIINPARLAPHASTEVCGQCHAMKYVPDHKEYMKTGFTYRPGAELDAATPLLRHPRRQASSRVPDEIRTNAQFMDNIFWPDGMIRVTGREYSGLVESPCHVRGGLSCLSCHSMHASSPDDQLASGMTGNQACVQCHTALGKDLSAHTRHRPESSGSQCYNCHMPYATYGLLKVVRNHQIDSPSARSTLETGRPNACNLCHLDQTLQWTANHLVAWTGKPSPRLPPEHQSVSLAVLSLLKGDVAQRALVAGNAGNEDARNASGDNWLAFYLAGLLDDPYPAIRYMSWASLRKLPGYESLAYDFLSPTTDRVRIRDEIESRWRPNPNEIGATHLLLDKNGHVSQERKARLLKERDHRILDLIE